MATGPSLGPFHRLGQGNLLALRPKTARSNTKTETKPPSIRAALLPVLLAPVYIREIVPAGFPGVNGFLYSTTFPKVNHPFWALSPGCFSGVIVVIFNAFSPQIAHRLHTLFRHAKATPLSPWISDIFTLLTRGARRPFFLRKSHILAKILLRNLDV